MTAADVIEVADALEEHRLQVWIDGGWGVDALVGEETRPHGDLDLAVDRRHLTRIERTLGALGFQHDRAAEPGLPARLVLRDADGREVDVHPLVFDERGDGWQQLSASGRAWGRYPAADLRSRGSIGGRMVRCLSPELQFRFRLGYEWSGRDENDLRLLGDRFELALPPPLATGTAT